MGVTHFVFTTAMWERWGGWGAVIGSGSPYKSSGLSGDLYLGLHASSLATAPQYLSTTPHWFHGPWLSTASLTEDKSIRTVKLLYTGKALVHPPLTTLNRYSFRQWTAPCHWRPFQMELSGVESGTSCKQSMCSATENMDQESSFIMHRMVYGQ